MNTQQNLADFTGRVLIAAIFLLAGFSIVSAVIFHGALGDPTQFILFMKNVAIAGGFLFLVARGPGSWSLDARRARLG